MSCSLAQAGQGRLVPADGAIQDQSRDLNLLIKFVQKYTQCQFGYIIPECET